MLVIGIIAFIWYIKVNTDNQNDANKRIETHDEWFVAKEKQRESESYYDAYRIDYNAKNKEIIKTMKANEITYLEMFSADGSKTKIEGTPMIKRTYTFYGLDGLGRGHHREHEPTNLATFCKNPFNKWYNLSLLSSQSSDFDFFHTKHKDKDSQFDGGNGVSVSPSNNYIYLKYEGPKWLLEEDKDFFMDEVNCPTNQKDEDNHVICKTYYLHFNPKQAYITLYTQKHNTKENK